MFKFLCGDVNPRKYGGMWFNHDEGEDYAHIIELISHDWCRINDGKKYTGILSCVCLDRQYCKKTYKKLTLEEELILLALWIGGDHILSLTGNNYTLIMKTLKDAIYSEPYTKISPTLDARWF